MQRPFNSEPLLRLEAVWLTLMSQAGPVNILNGIDLKIGKGEAIGLVGPSGSGKSTMLMVMAGLERPTSGKVTVAGQELSKFDEDAAARFRRGNVGIVFQSFHLIPTMSALENVAVPLELAMVANAFDRAREELKAVGLSHRVDHYPSQLSGGEQQRVALARAIAPRPGILFADEPTGNLDGRTGGEIMDLMFALQRERGATLILVTHDEDLVKRCDRIVRLRDGRIDGIETVERRTAPIILPPPAAVAVKELPATVTPPTPVPEAATVAPPEQPTPEIAASISVAAPPAEIAVASVVAEPAAPVLPELATADVPDDSITITAPDPDPIVEAPVVAIVTDPLPATPPVVGPAPPVEIAIAAWPLVVQPAPSPDALVTERPADREIPAEAQVRDASADAAPDADARQAEPVGPPPQIETPAEPEFRRVAAGGE